MPVVVAGATGFVGERLVARLVARGSEVRAGSRRPRHLTGATWVELDVDRPRTIGPALEGARVAWYLVHGMDGRADYATREQKAAAAFALAAREAGVERIVYLGGVAPSSGASRHLDSRRRTGELLREGGVPVFELRATMIVGAGSASWRMVRDGSQRLPVIFAPGWMRSCSEPVAIDDVVDALCTAGDLPIEKAGVYGLPGPELLDGVRILQRVCALRGTAPYVVPLPWLPQALAARAFETLSGTDRHLVRELMQGLRGDLVLKDPPFWPLMSDRHRLVPFDEMVRRAFVGEGTDWRLGRLAAEWISYGLSRKVAG